MQPDLFSPEEEKKKRKKPVALAGRSRKFLEHEGYITALVERSLNVPPKFGKPEGFRHKFDAWGFADLAAIHPDKTGTLWIQVTDHAHRLDRLEKVLAARAVPTILSAYNRVELHTWKASKKKGLKLWCLRLQRIEQGVGGGIVVSDVEERWFRENMQEVDGF